MSAALGPAGAALSLGRSIGRYFALVSLLPALMLVLWGYVLIAGRAWAGAFSPHEVALAFSDWSIAKVTVLVLIALTVGLFVHPLEFATTQLLEGYWGPSTVAVALMRVRSAHHLRRRSDLDRQESDYAQALTAAREEAAQATPQADGQPVSPAGDRVASLAFGAQEARSRAEIYPDDAERVMPTRLGNAFRRFEDAAGSQYGLDAIRISPHLHMIIPARHHDYLTDSREELDMAIRLCAVSIVAATLSLILVPDGWWLLLALVPYGLAYLAYRGAISAAQAYGVVLASVIDLDRFRLYDALHVARPRSTVEEREHLNPQLMFLLAGEKIGGEFTSMRYGPRER